MTKSGDAKGDVLEETAPFVEVKKITG